MLEELVKAEWPAPRVISNESIQHEYEWYNKIMGKPTQLKEESKPTNFGNNTWQYAVPG